MARPWTDFLKKDTDWRWDNKHAEAFRSIKEILLHAPILAFQILSTILCAVCDASDLAIGSALLQTDAASRERVIAIESRQLKDAEKNYPVHDQFFFATCYKVCIRQI